MTSSSLRITLQFTSRLSPFPWLYGKCLVSYFTFDTSLTRLSFLFSVLHTLTRSEGTVFILLFPVKEVELVILIYMPLMLTKCLSYPQFGLTFFRVSFTSQSSAVIIFLFCIYNLSLGICSLIISL